MRQEIKCNEEEMKAMAEATPAKYFCDNKKMAWYAKSKNLSNMDVAQIIAYSYIRFPEIRLLKIKSDNYIKFGELYHYFKESKVSFIIIHRVNFLVHQAMDAVYDLLEREKRLRFATKKHVRECEKIWNAQNEAYKNTMNIDSWFAIQDHFIFMEEMLELRIDKLYTAIRDHMIKLGWRDVELKGRIEYVLLLIKCSRHTFRAFFKEFENACGVDFSECFQMYTMDNLEKRFIMIVESLGIKVGRDSHGFYELSGLNVLSSTRITWAWDDFINSMRDDDLMDESALRAISLNPTIEEDYRKTIQEENEKDLSSSIEKLGEKFKVTRKK